MAHTIKNFMKRFFIINFVNSFIKSKFLKIELKYRRKKFKKKYSLNQKQNDRFDAISEFKRRHKIINPIYTPKKLGDLNIFWVGASQAQDESGFLQALSCCGTVHTFENSNGTYGPIYEQHNLSAVEIIALNDKTLIRQVQVLHREKKIDVLIGQMWAHVFSEKALINIRELGIPVLNIAMDDKLPNLWRIGSRKKVGSVGLGDGVDLTLTTVSEAVAWYTVENMPAIFWPLGSDPDLFSVTPYSKKDIDILFIGNRYGIRGSIVDFLHNNGLAVTCFGNGWPNGYADANTNILLSSRAKIILGVGVVGHCNDVYTLKLRDFDSLMTGALYITHRNPDLLELFTEGEHLECYSNKRELLQKLIYYTENPIDAARIGAQGYKFASQNFSWIKRLSETLYDLDLCH